MVTSVTVTITAEHDGSDTTGYRLLVDGKPVATKAASDVVNGKIAFEYAETAGSHTFAIEAYREPEVSETKTVTIA